MNRQLGNFAIRLVILVAILLSLGRIYGASLVAPMLPALTWIIETVDDRLHVDYAFIVEHSADTVIQLKVTPIRMLFLGDRMLMPDAKLHFDPRILLGSVLQPVILLLATVLAWPVDRLSVLAARLIVAVPMMAFLLAVNVPLGLVGVILDFREYLVVAPVTLWVYWNDFLQTGGSLVLAITASILVISVTDLWRVRCL